MVRLIFSDIDGTLINSNFKVTPKTRQGIKQIVAQGATFVPISARMPEAITPIMEQIGIDSYIISYKICNKKQLLPTQWMVKLPYKFVLM